MAMDFPFQPTSELTRVRASHRGTWTPYPANARITRDGEVPFIRQVSQPVPVGAAVNQALERLATQLALNEPDHERLRLEFGYDCVLRVKHFIEELAVADCLFGLGQFLSGSIDRSRLEELATKAFRLANQHPGSRSIDGAGHAAVSATYAVANALAGKTLRAAEYAAYAMVYGQGGYGAVTDRESFEPEFAWQVQRLASLAGQEVRKQREA